MSNDDSTRTTILVLGKTYTFAPDSIHNAEQLNNIARLVEETVECIRQQRAHQSPLHIAVLTGLNLVDQLFKTQSEYQSTETELSQRANRLTASLGRIFQDSEIDQETN